MVDRKGNEKKNISYNAPLVCVRIKFYVFPINFLTT